MAEQSTASRPKAYLKARHKRVREAMEHLQLDALLLTHTPDLGYLTDFTGDDSVGLIGKKSFHLVTDFRYTEQAEIEAPWLTVHMREGKMSDALAEAIAEAGVKRIGFEANFTTFGQAETLRAALKEKSPKAELVPLEGSDQCCGSAGIYNLLEPEVAGAVLAPKLRAIAATGAAVVATGNPGCLMQIGGGLVQSGAAAVTRHPVELLDAGYARDH